MINELASDDDDTVDEEDGARSDTETAQLDPNADAGDLDADEELDDETSNTFGGFGAPLH